MRLREAACLGERQGVRGHRSDDQDPRLRTTNPLRVQPQAPELLESTTNGAAATSKTAIETQPCTVIPPA